jgi:hypothetical protein
MLLSYVLLVDYYPLKEEYSFELNELIVHLWLFTFIFEEVRQVRNDLIDLIKKKKKNSLFY